MVGDSWTHKVARVYILPLVNSPITPNHLTTIRLITGVAACSLFAIGTTEWNLYGGFLWILSAFMDLPGLTRGSKGLLGQASMYPAY